MSARWARPAGRIRSETPVVRYQLWEPIGPPAPARRTRRRPGRIAWFSYTCTAAKLRTGRAAAVATALPRSEELVGDGIETQLRETQPAVVEVPEVGVQPVVEEADAFGIEIAVDISVDRG